MLLERSSDSTIGAQLAGNTYRVVIKLLQEGILSMSSCKSAQRHGKVGCLVSNYMTCLLREPPRGNQRKHGAWSVKPSRDTKAKNVNLEFLVGGFPPAVKGEQNQKTKKPTHHHPAQACLSHQASRRRLSRYVPFPCFGKVRSGRCRSP